MDGFKEFQGRSLDEAISEACGYFDATRERLEIDIIQDSKSGIFGLVGARKAKIKARRVQLRTAVDDVLGRKREAGSAAEENHPKAETDAQQSAAATDTRKGQPLAADNGKKQQNRGGRGASSAASRNDVSPAQTSAPASAVLSEAPAASTETQPRAQSKEKSEIAPARAEAPGEKSGNGQNRRRGGRGRGRDERSEVPAAVESAHLEDPLGDEVVDDLQHIPFEQLDTARLCALSEEVVARLVEPIVGRPPLGVELLEGRVNVCVDCGDDSGLLIGREGQTLASLQYLASRMVSRGMNAAVRVQLDAGEYRVRQDEKLREMALVLAEKVRTTGKAHSTRPLSSYHRRIVHVALQDAPDVQTRSSGDGPLKRVVVQRKKN